MKSNFIRNNLLFVVGAAMVGLSLIFSTISVLKVMSAPLQSPPSVPGLVGFEGYLANANGTPVANGQYSMTFAIYDASSGGSQWWSQGFNSVPTSNGLYNVQLSVPSASNPVWNNSSLYLDVSANITGTMVELSPRTQINSVPFALNAVHANAADNATTAADTTKAGGYYVGGSLNPHVLVNDSSGNVTVSNALAIGASGVPTATGQLALSDRIIASTSTWARAYHNTTVACGNASWCLIPFNSTSNDSANIHNIGTYNSRMTAPYAGVYVLDFQLSWNPASGNYRLLQFRKNSAGSASGGTLIAESEQPFNAIGGGTNVGNMTAITYLNGGDYIETFLYQDCGGTLTIGSDNGLSSPIVTMVRLP